MTKTEDLDSPWDQLDLIPIEDVRVGDIVVHGHLEIQRNRVVYAHTSPGLLGYDPHTTVRYETEHGGVRCLPIAQRRVYIEPRPS